MDAKSIVTNESIVAYYFYITLNGNKRLHGIYHSLNQCEKDHAHATSTGTWDEVSDICVTQTIGDYDAK